MTTATGFAIGAAFLASCVEFVEAFTVILAVGITRNWRSSLLGAAAAAVALAAIIGLFGVTLVNTIPIDALRGVIGTLVLVFGLKWLRKSILRFAGVKGMHDEGEIFEEETAKLRAEGGAVQPMDWLGFTISFKGTLLEGLEVAFIVLTFGLSSGSMELPVIGAAAAFVVIGIAGVLVRRPLEQVPENTMKWIVGVMLSSFGTFWAGEGLGVSWPGADLSIVGFIAIYVLFTWLATRWLQSSYQHRKQLTSAAAA